MQLGIYRAVSVQAAQAVYGAHCVELYHQKP